MEKNRDSFYEVMRARRSVRQYLDQDVEREVLDRILETGRLSPSAANCQPWHFIVIDNRHPKRKALNEVFYKDGFKKAPVVIAACAEPSRAWVRGADEKNYAWVDVTIAITEMILAATAEGVGTCWVASFDLKKALEILKIPKEMELVTLLTLGYPKEPLESCEKDRKRRDEILHMGEW